MGAAGLSKIRWFPSRSKDPGAPVRVVMVRPDDAEGSAGGDDAGESPRHGSGMTGFEEGLRESWDHGHGTRACGLKRLREFGAYDLLLARAEGRGASESEGRGGRGDASRPSRSKGPPESEPQERQRTQRVRMAGERANRRGSERLRGRTVAGEANPRHTDLFGRSRWRGVNPQEGRAGPCWTGEDVATRTLRGRRSLWKPSCGLAALRRTDRRNTSRPWKRRGGSGNR
jgi:hypothetical protein